MTYKLVNFRGVFSCVKKTNGSVVLLIPPDSANTDYQAFLKYQAEGGKVYGADEEISADGEQA